MVQSPIFNNQQKTKILESLPYYFEKGITVSENYIIKIVSLIKERAHLYLNFGN
jgi:hypothetical protein